MEVFLFVTAVAGAAGGIASYLVALSRPEPLAGHDFLARFTLGIVVAFTVPLFLSLAESGLVDDLLGDGGSADDIFIYGGFCIIAAYSAPAFLDGLTKQLLQRLNQVSERTEQAVERAMNAENQVDLVEEKLDAAGSKAGGGAEGGGEPASTEGKKSAGEKPAPAAPPAAGNVATFALMAASDLSPPNVSEEEGEILAAVARMGQRTLGGIATDSKLPRDRVERLVPELVGKGLLEPVTSPRTGNLRHRMTPLGTAAYKKHLTG